MVAEQRQIIVSCHQHMTVTGVPAFQDNVIWVLQPEAPNEQGMFEVAVVDPGEAAPVIDFCRRHQLSPTTILLTHHHADHTGGVAEIVSWMQSTQPSVALKVYGPAAEDIPVVTHPLSGGELIEVCPGINSQVWSVPGHTRGHLAYVIGADDQMSPTALFSGDLIFGLGCGRLFEGTAVQMYDAIKRVSQLEDDTRIYCAHEYTLMNLPFAQKIEPTNQALQIRGAQIRALAQAGETTLPLSLHEEKETNPFFRCEQNDVALASGLAANTDPVEVFASLREQRNSFKAS